MKSKIILKILIIFSFTGCYNREQNSLLNEAEALLQNKPDSALSILQQFTPGSQQAENEVAAAPRCLTAGVFPFPAGVCGLFVPYGYEQGSAEL